jgi:flagellar hook-basal body complex protein FliE
MTIGRIDGIAFAPPESPTAITPVGTTDNAVGGTSFESLLGDAISQANSADFAASQKTTALATGAIDDLHGTMIAVKEADISMKLVGTVRNKILEAFQELWKTSV